MNNLEALGRGQQRLVGCCICIDIDVHIERWHTGVGLHFGMGTGEFDGLMGASERIDSRAKNILLHIAVEFATGLLEFVKLRMVLISVEEKDSTVGRQIEAGSDFGGACLLGLLFGFKFLVELNGRLRRRAMNAFLL